MRNRLVVVFLWLAIVSAILFMPIAAPSTAQNAAPRGGAGAGQQGQRGGAQQGRGGGAAAQPAPPAPRGPDGRVILGATLGSAGVWQGDGRLAINPNSYEPRSNQNALIHIDAIPLQPWARAIVGFRHAEYLKFEPHARCKASGGPREFVTPYGFEIVDMPELQRVYMFDIGGPHSFRVIYMDGRSHPANLIPSYYGHSVGHWEGDTLVVDAVGFNEKFWMNRDGLPHTDRLHLTERFTRTDLRTLKYDVTVDDPGAYTAPWTSGFSLRWTDGQELFEYSCQDNNRFPDAVLDNAGQVDPSPKIAP
jgi:hypothetical protein